jgi:hypothetical protein
MARDHETSHTQSGTTPAPPDPLSPDLSSRAGLCLPSVMQGVDPPSFPLAVVLGTTFS